MHFAIICHDKPNSVAMRASIRSSHLDYLHPNLDKNCLRRAAAFR